MEMEKMIDELVFYPVSIVGTGPGDPDLLTVRAARIIRNADVILYDCHTAESALSVASITATVRFVEREKEVVQAGVYARNSRMVELIKAYYNEGLRVVRLRVGDPMMFGGANDDCRALERLHIPYEVVAGVSAGAAAACTYALPISEKYQSDSVTYLIANEIVDNFALVRDSAKLLRHGSAIVFYMATVNLEGIVQTFLEEGVPAAMPIVAVSKSGWPDEAYAVATIGDVSVLWASGKLREPVVYFVGHHLAIRNLPIEKRPLAEELFRRSGT